jgi:hypothetical protein
MRFKLNLQQFGGSEPEQRLDQRDTKDDNIYEITHNGITYRIPTSTLNLGTTSNLGLSNEAKASYVDSYIRYYIDSNGSVDEAGFRQYLENNGINLNGNQWKTAFNTLNKENFKQALSSDIQRSAAPITPGVDAEGKISAFNQYYSDLYSLEPGTSGAQMLSRLEQSYANQAEQAAVMADVGFQQAAMQQAQTVKQITDQVRSERMARLRAGMSEAQIANQDMQMLLTNVNTLNQNAQMLNDQRLQAQIGINTAQDTAYQDFLAQANQRGQVATGMAASDAGDVYQQTIRQMSALYGNDPSKWTSSQWQQVSQQVAPNPNTK